MSILLLLPWSQGGFLLISWALVKAVLLKALGHATVPDSVFISAMGLYPSTTYITLFQFCFWIKSH